MNQFVHNLLSVGFGKIMLILIVLIIIRLGVDLIARELESVFTKAAKVYWYDALIDVTFLAMFIMSIYFYKEI